MDRLLLIANIHDRPALWDVQSDEYKCRATVPDMWKEVAVSMGPDVTVDECKRKWKNLRDAYRAEIKRIEFRIEKDLLKRKYNPTNDYSSKWAYFEHMKFIKDIRRPRRRQIKEYITSSPNNTYDDDNELDQFSDLYSVDNTKLEDFEMNTDSLTEEKEVNNSQMHNELSNEAEKLKQARVEIPLPAAKKCKALLQSSLKKSQEDTDDKPSTTRCECKRSSDQVQFLENLVKEEQSLIKSTKVEITRSNDLAHVGDSDYNFLVSFLPQMKKMTELQNLKFRAKMSDFMFNIMSQSVTPAPSLQNTS